MKNLASEWASYRERVVPVTAGQVQVRECRRAFYAGAATMFDLVNSAASDPGLEATDDDVARMDAIHRELLAFNEDVVRGLA